MKFIFELQDLPVILCKSRVSWRAFLTKKDQEEGSPLCEGVDWVPLSTEGQPYTKLTRSRGVYLSSDTFSSREEACRAVYEVRKALDGCPVPTDVKRMILDMSMEVSSRMRDLDQLRSCLQNHKRSLFYEAKKLGLETVIEKDDVEPAEAFRNLMKWCPEFGMSIKELEAAGKASGWPLSKEEAQLLWEGKIPFLSQTVVYALLGKEDARTFFSLLKHAVSVAGVSWSEIEA